MALALGGLMGMLFTVVYFWLRGAISFEKSMESVPQGFIQMIAPILILTFAWTLCSFTRFGMYSAVFVKNAMAGAGDLKVFLPAVIRFNAGAESIQKEDRLARMAQAMGLPAGSDVADAVHDMTARLGLPTGLAAMGVTEDLWAGVIEHAQLDHCHKTNPRIASADDYRQMLAESM